MKKEEKTPKYVGQLSPYELEGDLKLLIEELQMILDRYPGKNVELRYSIEKEYGSMDDEPTCRPIFDIYTHPKTKSL